MVKIQKPTALDRSDLMKDFEKALFSSTTKRLRTQPPEVLRALDGLLIKVRRIAEVLHVKASLVRFWLTGRQKVPARHLPDLYALLRLAVEVSKDHISRAEKKELLWGQVAYPAEVLAMFRTRIKEAEAVLARAEEVVTQEGQQ